MIKKINIIAIVTMIAAATLVVMPATIGVVSAAPAAPTTPTSAKACTDSTCGRCYNQLSGTVFYCQDGRFTAGTCWVYNNNGGYPDWVTSPCTLSQFTSLSPGLIGQTAAVTDQAACGSSVGACCKKGNANTDCGIVSRINQIISFLAVIVGIACALGIIIGGVEYSSSGGDPKRMASGKDHITKAVVAVILFGFLYSFLQFIIPGGFLNG